MVVRIHTIGQPIAYPNIESAQPRLKKQGELRAQCELIAQILKRINKLRVSLGPRSEYWLEIYQQRDQNEPDGLLCATAEGQSNFLDTIYANKVSV